MGFKKGNMHYMSSLINSSLVTSGTFIPTLLDDALDPNLGQLYTKALGAYTVIGGLLIFHVNIVMDDLGSLVLADGAKVGNLPFVVAAGPASQASSGYGADLAIGNDRSMTGRCVEGTQHLEIRLWADASGNRNMAIFDMTRTSVLELSGAYPI